MFSNQTARGISEQSKAVSRGLIRKALKFEKINLIDIVKLVDLDPGAANLVLTANCG